MDRRSRRGEGGYTIIELLVVLLLLGFIAAAMSAGMQFGTRVWERSEARISTSQADDTAQTALRDLLSSATPRMEDGLARFHGEPDYVAFDATPPVAFGASGMAHVEIALAPGEAGSSLTIKVTSLIDGKKSRQVQLADHLGNVRFAYLDAAGEVPAWLDYWRDRPHLPAAVRLKAEMAGGVGAPWPVFVARLPIAQDARCDFDPVSTDCRQK
jgi:prepilin-type N-terminal cleavage/methylation domain-containing protein